MGIFDGFKEKFSKPATPEEYLRRVQKKHPPLRDRLTNLDYAQRIHQRMENLLPTEIRNLFEEGKIKVGESGELVPNAYSFRLPPDSYAIVLQAGLSRFIYRVSRVLHAPSRTITGPNSTDVEEPVTNYREAAEVVGQIFRNFMKNGKIAGPAGYKISDMQIAEASALADNAENFFYAHEIGHVLIWRKYGMEAQLTPEMELEADKIALAIVLCFMGEPTQAQRNYRKMAYAGAEFALRVFAGLTHLGFQFDKTHPPLQGRIQELRKSAAILAMTKQHYVGLTVRAFAFDQALEKMESLLAKPEEAANFVEGMTTERTLSSLWVLINECAKGTFTPIYIRNTLESFVPFVSDEVIRQVAQEAVKMYFVDPLINAPPEEVQMCCKEREVFLSNMPLLKTWGIIFKKEIENLPHLNGPHNLQIAY